MKYPVRVLEIFVDEGVDIKKLEILGNFKSLKCDSLRNNGVKITDVSCEELPAYMIKDYVDCLDC